jgi:hypothetical protein
LIRNLGVGLAVQLRDDNFNHIMRSKGR